MTQDVVACDWSLRALEIYVNRVDLLQNKFSKRIAENVYRILQVFQTRKSSKLKLDMIRRQTVTNSES